MSVRIRVATTSLAGCFGCHMSLLDLDERFLEIAARVEFDRTPLTDCKELGPCTLGLIEGGVANAENVGVLRQFRQRCQILVAVGACAVQGGIPALRNPFSLRECLEASYVRGIGLHHPGIPDDPEIPLLLDRVYPLHEVVRIDHFLPGCPPPAEAFWSLFDALLAGRPVVIPAEQIRYD